MNAGIICSMLLSWSLSADPITSSYSGNWVTTKGRVLYGTMTANLVQDGDKWKGTFYGVYEGARWSYNVVFTGTPEKLDGTASIDGANYSWTGVIKDGVFRGTFKSNRYDGNFTLTK